MPIISLPADRFLLSTIKASLARGSSRSRGSGLSLSQTHTHTRTLPHTHPCTRTLASSLLPVQVHQLRRQFTQVVPPGPKGRWVAVLRLPYQRLLGLRCHQFSFCLDLMTSVLPVRACVNVQEIMSSVRLITRNTLRLSTRGSGVTCDANVSQM